MALLHAAPRDSLSSNHHHSHPHPRMFSRFTASIAELFTHRSKSEPIPDQDTRMDPPKSLHRYRSEYNLHATHNDHTSPNPSQSHTPFTATDLPLSSSPVVREPSLAETEIDDPDSQDVANATKARGVKIRDFAYPTSRSDLNGTSTTMTPPRVSELFDQYKGLGEVYYRWSQPQRTYPITGKTLRRLLDLGWLTQDDVDQNADPMDIEELRKHDSRPHYPWKPHPMPEEERGYPSQEKREEYRMCVRTYFVRLDNMRRTAEALAERLEKERIAGAEAQRRIDAQAESVAAAQREYWLNTRFDNSKRPVVKRTRETDDDDDDIIPTEPAAMTNGHDDVFLDARDRSDKKRLRLTPPVELQPSSSSSPPSYACSYSHSSSQPITGHSTSLVPSCPSSFSQPPFQPPAKQYPAPLSAYDPRLYPEVASQGTSQGYYGADRSGLEPKGKGRERTPTPPPDDDEQSESQVRHKVNVPIGQRLVHPKTQKRNGLNALNRTQTFAQL